MPIYSRWTSGYPIGDLVNILLKSDMATRQVCTVQPLGISENAAFVIDVEEVDLQDLKADDTDSWHPTGTKKSYFDFLSPECFVSVRNVHTMNLNIMFSLAAITFTSRMTSFITRSLTSKVS